MTMNKFRVTFHSVSGTIFKTVIEGEDYKEVKKTIKSVMDEEYGRFLIDGKRNRFFEVKEGQLTFVEYEMLYNDEKVSFQSLTDFDLISLGKILADVSAETIAKAVYRISGKEREVFQLATDLKKFEQVEKLAKKMGHVETPVVEEAQKEIVLIANRLIENNEIEPR